MSPMSLKPGYLVLKLLLLAGTAIAAAPAANNSDDEPNAQRAEVRTWTDITGKYKVKAEFLEFKGGKVLMKKKDGTVSKVAIEKLSEADQRFVKLQPQSATTAEKTHDAVKSEGGGTDAEQLRGSWKVLLLRQDGRDEMREGSKACVVFSGDSVSVFVDNVKVDSGRCKLDPTKSPKWIDLESNGVLLGIYGLDGDDLKICLGSEKRPNRFESAPESGLILWVLKRDRTQTQPPTKAKPAGKADGEHGEASEPRFDQDAFNKAIGYALAKGVPEHVMKLRLADTQREAFQTLLGFATHFIKDDNGKLNPHASKEAFAAAVRNVTPEMLKRGRELVAEQGWDTRRANASSFLAFISTSDDFLRPGGEFPAKAFNAAFANLDAEKTEKAASLMKTSRAVALCHLLTASSRFVKTDGEFDATPFNARLKRVLETEITGSEDARIKQFLATMRPE